MTFDIEDYKIAMELITEFEQSFGIKLENTPKDIPDKYFNYDNEYVKKAEHLFYCGGKAIKKEKFKNLNCISYLKAVLCSFDLSHEMKMAIAGQVLELFFD